MRTLLFRLIGIFEIAGGLYGAMKMLNRLLPLGSHDSVLALIGLYRVSDVVMGIMANPFYVDMGYKKEEVAAVTKVFGMVMTLLGGFVGGSMAVRWGVMRVLMLGPVTIALSLIAPRLPGASGSAKPVGFFRFVPWFILGFLALATLRSIEVVPADVVDPLTKLTGFLTVVSMAALGLGVDVRVLAGVGGRVTAAVTLSLTLLLGVSLGLIQLFH